MSDYNIYCDESCHLQNDNSDTMFLGAISVEKSMVKQLSKGIRSIKQAHGLNQMCEIKWTKVSPSKFDLYKDLIDYFYKQEIRFRCVIAKGKDRLNNHAFNQSYDDWYYKMYYVLLSKMLNPVNQYSIYLDIKDTRGGEKTRILEGFLERIIDASNEPCLQKLQIVKSHEIELIQLCDLLIGCVSYENRFLHLQDTSQLSQAKKKLCSHLKATIGYNLTQTIPLYETKFNIFEWTPR